MGAKVKSSVCGVRLAASSILLVLVAISCGLCLASGGAHGSPPVTACSAHASGVPEGALITQAEAIAKRKGGDDHDDDGDGKIDAYRITSRGGALVFRHDFPSHGTYRFEVRAKKAAGDQKRSAHLRFGVQRGKWMFNTKPQFIDNPKFQTYVWDSDGIAPDSWRIDFVCKDCTPAEPLIVDQITIRRIASTGTPRLTRGPMLQYAESDPTQAVVVWWTDRPTDAEVQYGPVSGGEAVARDTSLSEYHEVHLTGLKPNAEHRYRILSCNVVLDPPGGGRITFRTPPAVGSSGDISFVVLGDFGDGTDRVASVGDRMAELRPSPHFLMTVGDNVYKVGTTWFMDAHWLNFYRGPKCTPHAFADLNRRTFVAPAWGNHDHVPDGLRWLLPMFVLPKNAARPEKHEFYYWFEAGDVLFVVLDWSHIDDQTAWLKDVLSKSKRRWKFVFTHHIPLWHGRPPNAKLLDTWGRVFETEQVDIVFSGHDHRYYRWPFRDAWDAKAKRPGADGKGTTYVVTGGASNTRAPPKPPELAASAAGPQFTKVTVSGGKGLMESIRANEDGTTTVIDSYAFTAIR